MMKKFLLDLDGTLYSGDRVLPHAPEFIELLKAKGYGYLALTNCPSKTQAQVSDKLVSMGIDIGPEQVLTSGMATATVLKKLYGVSSAYILGTAPLKHELEKQGIIVREQSVDAVVIGYDTGLTYDSLTVAVQLARGGAMLFATNIDNSIPHGDKRIPHTGAIAKAVEFAADKECIYIGKPQTHMFDIAHAILQGDKADYIMVGDRLDTDVLFAKNSSIMSCWVYGEGPTPQNIPPGLMPDLVAGSLSEIITKGV